nr:PREDICTED: pregnancy-specific beta-1-glycoprotein 8-like isoform X1 [Lepisosteus oculatus]
MQINAGLFILLPVVLQQTSSARTDKIIYGLLNGHVQISPSLSGSFQEVIWHFGVNKVAEWDSLTNKPDYYPPFKGRTHLEKNATLSIENLTEKDSGGYTVDMHINEKVQTQQFTIEVIRPVSKPNITAKCNETQCSLSCEGDSTVREYSWSINGRVGSWSNTAERLLIWRNESLEYVCKVRNPKSEEESEPFVIEPLSGGRMHLILILPVVILLITLLSFAVKYGRNGDTKQYMGVPSSEASTEPESKRIPSTSDDETLKQPEDTQTTTEADDVP